MQGRVTDIFVVLHQNIFQAFGGNSSSITLFGEEAGGSAVHIHTLNAENDPIFHSAIVQSAQYDDGVLSKEQCKDQFQGSKSNRLYAILFYNLYCFMML